MWAILSTLCGVIEPINALQVLGTVDDLWSPQIVGELDNYDVKAANVAGEYPEHDHPDTDEFFVVLSGRLHLDLPDRTISASFA